MEINMEWSWYSWINVKSIPNLSLTYSNPYIQLMEMLFFEFVNILYAIVYVCVIRSISLHILAPMSSIFVIYIVHIQMYHMGWGLGLWYLKSLSKIFKFYHGGLIYWWRKRVPRENHWPAANLSHNVV